MTYSIIMPSFLGTYHGAAKNRIEKFHRAVESVMLQSDPRWELLIVSDGCATTIEEAKRYLNAEITIAPAIRLLSIDKAPIWSPQPRNAGILHAKGEWITYLDTDDHFGPDHLAKLRQPQGNWGYFNILEQVKGEWAEVVCEIKPHRCGTGNLIHRPGIFWPEKANDYAHDWTFIRHLKTAGIGEHLQTPEYFNCHIPGRYDV